MIFVIPAFAGMTRGMTKTGGNDEDGNGGFFHTGADFFWRV
ncbi:MAG: hypothetical protein ACR2P4_03090 [Gammaproteobacteria bacterium]